MVGTGSAAMSAAGRSPETMQVTAKPAKIIADLSPPSLCLLSALQTFYKVLQMSPTTLVKLYLPEQNCNYLKEDMPLGGFSKKCS